MISAGDKCPEPAFVAVGPMSGFIRVEHRLVWQRRLEFGVRGRHGRARLLPRRLRAAETDRNLQRPFQQPPDDQAGQPAHDRQVGNQRRELRAKLAHHLLRKRRLRGLPARGASSAMTAIFGDVRLDGRQFRHLMAARTTGAIAHAQAALAMPTRVGNEINDRVHALGGDQWSRVTEMSRWSPGFRQLLRRRPPTRCRPARPSEAGGFDVVVEFWLRSANWRSRSAICFFASAISFARPSPAAAHARPMPRGAAHSLVSGRRHRDDASLGLRHALLSTPVNSICTDLNCYKRSLRARFTVTSIGSHTKP